MNHFGIAFGVIVATVIGGAVVFDRSLANKTIAQPHPAPAATVAQGALETSVADTSAGDVAKQPAILDSKQAPVAQLEVKQRPSLAVKQQPAGELKQRPSKTQRTVVASGPESAPAPLNAEPASAAPAPAPAAAPAPAPAPSEPAPAATSQPAGSASQSD